jgi:hypothetical protein
VPLADVRPALRAFLLADPTVSAAVGGERIFPVVMPQGERRPSLVYNIISESTDHVTTGPSGLVMARMQIDSYASTPDEGDSLARLVKDRLDGFSGLMGSVEVGGVFAETARTDYQADSQLHRSSRDYRIWFSER